MADTGEISLSDGEFKAVVERVYREAGISLGDAKRTLVVSRLSRIIKEQGMSTFTEYLKMLDTSGNAQDKQKFINALTTNLTRFFREDHHFDHLTEFVGELIKNPPRINGKSTSRLRIWSAGCSTGQEPYTIAMSLLDKYPQLDRWDFKILATDIDTQVIEKGKSGAYTTAELAGMEGSRARLFEMAPDGSGKIPQKIKNLVTFKPLNLMGDWPIRGPFDAIFCRNVTIYFDKPTQGRVFDRMGDVLAQDGHLYIGHSENLKAVCDKYDLIGKTIYQLKPLADQKTSPSSSRSVA